MNHRPGFDTRGLYCDGFKELKGLKVSLLEVMSMVHLTHAGSRVEATACWCLLFDRVDLARKETTTE